MSFGGACGGLFVTLVATNLFDELLRMVVVPGVGYHLRHLHIRFGANIQAKGTDTEQKHSSG